MKNKLIALFTVIFFASSVVKAEDTPDYEHLEAGNCVNYNGFFFTENGMIKLVTTTEEKIKLAVLDKQKELDLLKIDLTGCQKTAAIQLSIQKEMFESQLRIKQASIDAYRSESFWNGVKFGTGGIVLGLVVGSIATFLLLK